MTRQEIKALLERVETWPQERQEEAARLLAELEAQATTTYRLSDEQVAEVERRLAEPKPTFMTLAEVRARFRQIGA